MIVQLQTDTYAGFHLFVCICPFCWGILSSDGLYRMVQATDDTGSCLLEFVNEQ